MYSTINEWKLKTEGRKVYANIKKLVNSPLYKKMDVKNIRLKESDFEALLEGVLPSLRNECKDRIPDVMGFTIVRIK